MTTELPDVEVLDVFVIDEHGDLATAESWQRTAQTAPPSPSRAGEADEPGAGQPPPSAHAISGGGSVTPPPPLIRTFGHGDVSQAVTVDPTRSKEILQAPDAFHGISGLHIHPSSAEIDGPSIRWPARLRVGPGRWREVEVLVHPSASWVLTVIELRSTSRRRPSRRFLQAGLGIVDELSDRLRLAGAASSSISRTRSMR